MSWESGERRHHSDDDDFEDGPETSRLDNSYEGHDEGDSTLERCLREYEETLADHPDDDGGERGQLVLGAAEHVGDTEETSLNSLDEDYPQETSAATHEADKGDDLIAWSLGEYEETMDPPSSSTETTSGAEEHGATVVEFDQVGDDESEIQRSGSIKAQGAEVAGTEGVEAGELVEQTGEQSTSSESTQNVSESPAEDQQSSSRNEAEVEEQQGESRDRSEEHIPLRLSDDPEAFAGKNSEQLVELGILPEQDEVKLDENTTLRFDASEGLTMVHGDQRYEITTVEYERIGGLDLFRFKTEQGEEFLHIPDQDKLVPPTEMPWYAYPSHIEVYLDREYKHELLDTAIDRAGSQAALRREMEEAGACITSGYLSKHLYDDHDGMSEDKLISVLSYLGRDLDEATSHIFAIGHIEAVKAPELPFNLGDQDGARLLAARYGDGTLSASQDRGPTFHYANKDEVMRDRVVESVRNVFGGANILNREYDNGEVAKVRTSSDVIGFALQRAGAIVGEVVDQNPHIPTWIQQGSIEIKHEWLVQSFGDEGYVWPQRGKVCIGRSVEASSVLSDEMTRGLDQLNWQGRHIGDVFVDGIRSCRDIPADINQAIREHPPNLLVEEKKMLEDFSIITEMYPSEMHRGKYGDYTAHWTLQTKTREDSRRFCDEIGFPQERKQENLISALRIER